MVQLRIAAIGRDAVNAVNTLFENEQVLKKYSFGALVNHKKYGTKVMTTRVYECRSNKERDRFRIFSNNVCGMIFRLEEQYPELIVLTRGDDVSCRDMVVMNALDFD